MWLQVGVYMWLVFMVLAVAGSVVLMTNGVGRRLRSVWLASGVTMAIIGGVVAGFFVWLGETASSSAASAPVSVELMVSDL